jgi:hypothetical protein
VSLQLFFSPPNRLRATRDDDRSYPIVRPVWAAPLTRPGQNLCLLDGKNEEIAMLENPEEELGETSFQAVREELRRRDLTATVRSVVTARQEYAATYWTVDTDRGQREFVTQNLSENAVWFGESRLLLLDVEGNRFEISDLEALDPNSRALVDSIL